MMNYTKFALAMSPLIVVILAQAGIIATEAEVSVWVNAVMWLVGILSSFVPSVRAWFNFREDAQ